MLHGYAQSGDCYRWKTSGLVRQIRQVFHHATFFWPDGPVHLKTSDIAGWNSKNYPAHTSDDGPQLRAWFHLRYVSEAPPGLSTSLAAIANILRDEGPFDGVIAFSQGTLIAGMVASLLEGNIPHDLSADDPNRSLTAFEYPEAFLDIKHPPFKFGILYASRVGQHQCYDWLYERPGIRTPFCLVYGRLDPMVDHDEREAATRLLTRGNGSCLWFHDGGHYVPTDAISSDRVIGFIRNMSVRQQSGVNGPTFHKHKGAPLDAVDLMTRLEKLVPRVSCFEQRSEPHIPALRPVA